MKTKKRTLLLTAILFTGALFYFFRNNSKNSSHTVKIETIKEGNKDSVQVQRGDTITLRYTNFLEDGTRLDSTENTAPFTFIFGESQILKGWNDGLAGAKIAEKRKVSTPYQYAYGEQGAPPKIPPKANIITEFEILNIERK